MRLAKHLAHAGIASRRAAEVLVFDGKVTVNGEVVTDPARDVTEADDVRVGQRPARIEADRRAVWMVHKPAGVVSTAKDTHGRPTVVQLVNAPGSRLYPVGRLDADTTGLILLTDDGDLAHKMTHPKFEVDKTYVAELEGKWIGEPALRKLREGVELEDGKTAPAQVRRLGPGTIELRIHEGRKRQVRRMCEAVGHPVRTLKRVGFAHLRLGELKEGAVRRLSPAEVERLRKAGRGSAPRDPGRDA